MKDQIRTDAPELNPLLQDANSLENQIPSGASISGAVFNISTTTVGAGIMSIPAAIKVLGIVPGFVVILVMAFLVDVSVEFMLRYTKHGESTTYAGLMAESFGPSGSAAVQLCVMITNLGCLIIYLIIIGDVLCGNQSGGVLHLGILQEWFGIHWWNSRAYALLFLVLFVMLPLVLLRRMDSLKHSSAISISLAVVFVIMCSTMAIIALFKGKTQSPRLLPDLGNQTSALDLFTAVPVLSTAFGFQVLVHPIRAELRKPSEMSLAIRISLAVCVAIYFSIGFFGYLLFGDSIMPDILVNFDRNSGSLVGQIINDFVRLSYAIHIALVFPVMNFSLRASIDELLFAKERTVLDRHTLRFMFLTGSLLALTYILAIALPNIWYFFQLIGSTTVVSIAFLFPAAIVIRDVYGISTIKDKLMAAVVIVVAVLTSTIAIYTNLSSSIKDKKRFFSP